MGRKRVIQRNTLALWAGLKDLDTVLHFKLDKEKLKAHQTRDSLGPRCATAPTFYARSDVTDCDDVLARDALLARSFTSLSEAEQAPSIAETTSSSGKAETHPFFIKAKRGQARELASSAPEHGTEM